MLFSSLIFLFGFLPLALIFYYSLPTKFKNYSLLLFSLIFFAWGGVSNTVILIAAILLNYFFGRLISTSHLLSRKKLYAGIGISLNILLLGIFKYANFITSNLKELFEAQSWGSVAVTDIVLPVGISFYTFHCISYLVDVYRGKTASEKSLPNLALYVSMFSQLVAGPIIRYSDVGSQIHKRIHSQKKFVSGIERFCIGLAKKVLLANNFAVVSDHIFSLNYETMGTLNAWLGMFCYSFQIYWDFSGYSDMAIGLGKMFGFDFKENFNFPYLATSVRDFWRRWHISLSTFFRDYVYIPLGGNQAGTFRTYLNLFFVFFLTGFWHGANWTFVCWGMIHGALMIVERLGFDKYVLQKIPLFGRLYTLMFVMLAWILFKIPDFDLALKYWTALKTANYGDLQNEIFFNFLDREFIAVALIGIFGSFGGFRFIFSLFKKVLLKFRHTLNPFAFAYDIASALFIAGVLILSTLYLLAGSYNPFIYYQF